MENLKCVMIIDENLPLGLISNTAAVMGVSLGKLFPGLVGDDVYDQSGQRHLGIVGIPIPVLKGDENRLADLRAKLYQEEFKDLTVIDFSDTAQGCKTYDEFTGKMASASDSRYFGLAICGNKKQVNQLTGNMPLLR